MPRPISWPSAPTILTASPRWKWPWMPRTPAGSRLLPARSAVVDDERAVHLQRAGDPALAGGDGIGRREEPGAFLAAGDAPQRMIDLAARDDHRGAGGVGDLARLDLGAHAATGEVRRGVAGH